jgi:preprotein translocase subunit SecG
LPAQPEHGIICSHFELGEEKLTTSLQIVQIIVAATLIALILLQAKGTGLGGIFGGDSSVYKSRRGVEKTLFNATIGLSVVFFLVAIVNVIIAK